LFQSGRREDALEELVRPGTDHLQSPDAMTLLQRMRGDGVARAQGARTRAVDSGAEETPGFRSAAAASTNAESLWRDGRSVEGVKGLWETERLFAASILPPRPPEAPRSPASVPAPPPALPGVSDQVLRNVLARFKQAYDSGQANQLERGFPQLKDEVRAYRLQLSACKQVTIDFKEFKVVEKDPSGASARVETRTIYGCVPKVGNRIEPALEKDLFDLEPGPGGTWTITRKWK
jgi:hypothetical protein